MTKSEKQKLRYAIKLIHDEDKYIEGMSLLCELAGFVFPAANIEIKPIELSTLIKKEKNHGS
jgi:hypothetical protein